MNSLKLFIGLLLCTFTIISCGDKESIIPLTEEQEISSSAFFEKNVSIFDARVRSIDDKYYVQELYLANFSENDWDKNVVSFENIIYFDNGLENDLMAGDGIYTSTEIFSFNDRIKYNSDVEIMSVLEKPIVSPNFVHDNALKQLASNYKYRVLSDINQAETRIFKITCDVSVGGSCGGCPAQTSGFCDDCCVCWSNCSVTVGF